MASYFSSLSSYCGIAEQLYRPVSQKVNWQTMAAERLKNRPPPPAYHEMIEQRFTSLWRQSTPSSSLTPLHFGDIPVDDHWRLNNGSMAQTVNVDNSGVLTSGRCIVVLARKFYLGSEPARKLSANSLEELIQNQKQVIDQQKFYLAKLDLDIDNDQHREVIQLGRQQENLRAVLNPLRECDWPNRLQHERIELQKITASISEFKQKLDAIAKHVLFCEIKLRTDEEHELKCNILAMEEELKQLEDEVDFAVLSGNHY
uniref:Nucleoporin Nup54 alpha-helical domain-containing protein n=1 Tax=Setaria digitata TaxID=48799 RepID=A0A915Q1X1_9BILA